VDIRTRLKKLEQDMIEPNPAPQREEAGICFPPGEAPAFHWMAEVETAPAYRRAMAATYEYSEDRL
jgi:hypothetical protein